MINIGRRRECFFDDFLIDNEKTTAKQQLHTPVKREEVLRCDEPWEGDISAYFNFFFDDQYSGYDGAHPEGVYRLYYLGRRTAYSYNPNNKDAQKGVVVCYAESADGINWVKPSLKLFQWDGNYDNNIILDKTIHPDIDNFMVFRDDNPLCPADEKYKGIAAFDEPLKPNGEKGEFRLFSFLSADGIKFRLGNMLTNKGYFDSLNVVYWDDKAELYRGFVRGVHSEGSDPSSVVGGQENWDKVRGIIKGKEKDSVFNIIRDVLYIESKDFKTWSDPVWLKYADNEEIQMYSNCISPYFRAPHMYVGFPARYFERTEWTPNYDQLTGREQRIERMEEGKRGGLVVSDCGFMTSRDGVHFQRFGNAFMRPGMENGRNWVYGDGFLTRGMAVTPSIYEGEEKEISLYMHENSLMGIPVQLFRHTIRLDGFVSLCATNKEEIIVTKPFVYDGDQLYANISTSARGYLYFTLVSETGERFESCEIFGDATEKKISFHEMCVSKLSGQCVTLEIRLFDADIYGIRFGD